LRICRGLAKDDDDVALVFAQLGERRLRTGLESLLERRLVAPDALRRYLANGPRGLTAASVCHQTAERLRRAVEDAPGGPHELFDGGPVRHPQFAMLADDLRQLMRAVWTNRGDRYSEERSTRREGGRKIQMFQIGG
jgi:hypothetical protein